MIFHICNLKIARLCRFNKIATPTVGTLSYYKAGLKLTYSNLFAVDSERLFTVKIKNKGRCDSN